MKSTSRLFQIHEAYVQKLLGLSSTISSGNKWHDPSDGIDRRHYSETDFAFAVDCKCTETYGFRLTRRTLRDWVNKAALLGKRFAMPIRFVYEDGNVEDYVLLTLNDFAEMLEEIRDRQD